MARFAAIPVLAMILLTACEGAAPTSTPIPTPTPTAQPAVQLYQYFHREKELNPVRFDSIKDAGGYYGFTGIISKIDGRRVQFHIEKRRLKKDEYLECEFSETDEMLNLNVGATVTIYGYLAEAGRIVKLKQCRHDATAY